MSYGGGGGRDGGGGRGPPQIGGMISLKVDNLTYRTTVHDLRRVFDKFGEVGDVYIPKDKYNRESRGFAFVRYYEKRDAEDAMDDMHGRVIDGRELRVQMAEYGRPDGGGRGGGGGGRYGGGGGGRDRGGGGRDRRDRRRSRSRSYERNRRRSRSRSHSRSRSRSRSAERDSSKSPRHNQREDSPQRRSGSRD